MNGLLAIAAAFLDRITNPRYGTDVNDSYTLRFNQLLSEDTEFARAIANLELNPDDVASLPMSAWPWYLKWRVGRADPPSPEFLDALFNAATDPAIHLAVVMSGMSDRGDRRGYRSTPDEAQLERLGDSDLASFAEGDDESDIRALQSPASAYERQAPIRSQWLRRRVRRLPVEVASERSVNGTVEIAAQLLQLGDRESVATLRQLLAIDWSGRRVLHDSVAAFLADAELDPESYRQWLERLRITEEGNGEHFQ
jgi:hypothetical protein